MANNKDWLPVRHEARYNQSFQTKTYVEGNLGAMGIDGLTAEWVNNTFKPAWQAFANAFLAWQDAGQRTPQKVTMLKEAEEAFVPLYRELYLFLKTNPVVKDDQLAAMGLPARKSNPPTPVAPPTTYPIAKIDIGTPRRLTVYYVDSATGKKGKPRGTAGAVIHWAVLPQPPVDDRELVNSRLNTNSPFVVDFLEEERHQVCYFLLTWQNTRGETGASGNIVSAMIP